MRVRAVLLAAALALAPLGARAADLVVWWEKGYYPEEDVAVAELVAAFEQKTGKDVELVLYPQTDLPKKVLDAFEAGRPPDFVFGILLDNLFNEWAHKGRLVNLTDAVGNLANLFDADAIEASTLTSEGTTQPALYGLPMGRSTNHLHVWTSLLERAGFQLTDVPKQWEPFWSFWCDKVQPAVRKATGRDDIWGVGLVMSVGAGDTWDQSQQFMYAYDSVPRTCRRKEVWC